MELLKSTLILVLFCSSPILSAKVLFVFPVAFSSHYRAFSPIIEGLVNKGHNVTALTAFKYPKPLPNYKEIVVTDRFDLGGVLNFSLRKIGAWTYMHKLWNKIVQATEVAVGSKVVQDFIHSDEQFDLIIVESTFQQECLLAFGHKFNAPVINMHPLSISPFIANVMGQPHAFSYIPDFWKPYTDRMGFWERAHNTVFGIYEIIGGNYYHIRNQEMMMQKYFNYPGAETRPSLKDLIQNISLHLLDSHYLMGYVRPFSPNVIEVAGMHLRSGGKLPADLQTFMDEAKDGVIYFSFGTHLNTSELTKRQSEVLIETLKRLKQRVIWKRNEPLVGQPKHILTRRWLPQPEILAHPNCKLFITHGGFNSLVEAMAIGVPVLGLPVFSDQFYNIAFYEQAGVGLGADLDRLTVSDLKNKIHRIIQDHSFAENARQIAARFKDEPLSSLEKAVYWIEYVIRHKGAHHLKPASVNMPYFKYLLLDIIGAIAVSLILIFSALFLSIRNALSIFEKCC